MSAGRSIVAAGAVGAALLLLKRGLEKQQAQGAVIEPASLKTAVDRATLGDRVDVGRLIDNLSSVFGGIGRSKASLPTTGGFKPPQASKPSLGDLFPGIGQTSGEPSNIGAQLMSDLQRDFGLKKHQAAGIVGNLDHESAGFKTLQEIKPIVPGSRGGWGYAQWTGPRRRDFEAWVKARGLDARSYAANYGFLKHELTNTWEKRAIDRLKRTSTVDEAAKVFSDSFLRPGIPHMQSRIQRARRYA